MNRLLRSLPVPVLVLLGGLAGGVLIWLALAAGGLQMRPWFAVVLGLGAALVVAVLRPVSAQVREPDIYPFRPHEPERRAPVALSVLESRLAGSSNSARVWETRLRPELVELAAERLRRRHGVDVDLDPEASREVLGEDLWQWLTRPRSTADPASFDPEAVGPQPAELDRILRRIAEI